MTSALTIPAAVVLATSFIAALTDVARFKVYNVLTYPVLLSGLAYHALTGGSAGFTNSMTGILFGFGVLLLPYMLGALGAGDLKFVAAIGAWMGMAEMFWVLVLGALANGVYSLIVVVRHKRYRQVVADLKLVFLRLAAIGRQFGADDDVESVQSMTGHDDRRTRLVPFSAMTTVGVVLAYCWQFWSGS